MDSYIKRKKEAGKLKLKGLRLLAEGGENTFSASVALHAAARAERTSIAELSAPDANTCLWAAIEECGCYIDAQAPRWAERAWRRIEFILEWSKNPLPIPLDTQHLDIQGLIPLINSGKDTITHSRLENDTRLDRIRDRFFTQQAQFKAALFSCPTLLERCAVGSLVLEQPSKRVRLKKEFDTLIARFVGDPHFWFSLYQLDEANDNALPGLESLWHALELDPEITLLKALYFITVSKIPEYRKAFENLRDSIFKNRENETREILVMHALSMLRVAETNTAQSANALEIAQEDLRVAATKKPTLRDSSDEELQKVQFLLNARIAGRVPSMDELVEQGILPAPTPHQAMTDLTFLMQQQLKDRLARVETDTGLGLYAS